MRAHAKLTSLVLTFVFIQAVIGSTVSARPVAGTITSSLSGGPLANVVVKILQTGDSTQTDGTGKYIFANVPDGVYTMLFGKSTYRPLIKTNVAIGACCVGLAGNVDCDPLNGIDISDLSTLIDNLYISMQPLCCDQSANTDGQPGVDISDLSALIDYLYISFTPTAPCQ
jgi:hypothetical protein